ncbi:heavy metal-associated isoprenylated plant protein 2-like [Ananas comosus]|uniref:Heavy metal-associated isoprenylated plant protein 2-like n=1 Tax=Ananas comosus TaxID=4615 RepID=A0A6P5G9I4_ANACO|nr:heavy metal-associated isoprenylated plant protein 2-like [Ananas comosus]
MKKIVLKISIICSKCKTTILQAVAKLDGIKSLELDEEKCTLTVVGTADVVDIVKELKKVKKAADVVSVGDNKHKKKEEEKCKELALCCAACRTMGFGSFRSFPSKLVYVEEPSSGCTII